MFRAVKFFLQFKDDDMAIRDTNTEAQYLDHVSATDSAASLKQLATKLGMAYYNASVRVAPKQSSYQGGMPTLTRAIKLTEVYTPRYGGDEPAPFYLGWVQIPDIAGLPIRETMATLDLPDSELDAIYETYWADQCSVADLGVSDWGEGSNTNETVLVMEGWAYYHIAPVVGYDLDVVARLFGCTREDETFADQVFRCSECETIMEQDNGYNYNYRLTDDGLTGIPCGCADELEDDGDADSDQAAAR